MLRVLVLSALMVVLAAAGTLAQERRKTVILEIWVPPKARVFVEGKEMRATGTLRLFVSPPLAEGKYVYTVKAVIPGRKGPREITETRSVRPGDFEMIDFRVAQNQERVPYEPTPQKVVEAMLRLAKLTKDDVLWDLGCGDGRIPVTAAKIYGCKARGFEIDPELVKKSLDNVKKNGVENLVTIEEKDIFTLDLSKEPTVVTLYLLPHVNVKLLPQLRKLKPGARIVSNSHRMGDIQPDQQTIVDTGDDRFTVFLWKVETLQR